MLIFQRSDQYFKNEINKTLSLCFLFSRRDSKREIIAGQKKKRKLQPRQNLFIYNKAEHFSPPQ